MARARSPLAGLTPAVLISAFSSAESRVCASAAASIAPSTARCSSAIRRSPASSATRSLAGRLALASGTVSKRTGPASGVSFPSTRLARLTW